ncbi:MAG: hypothetical protein IJ333_02455 [Clostridia bacterium]|nr:hypothetical protein [Clostridia bacterium]
MKTSHKILIGGYTVIAVLVIIVLMHIAVGTNDPYEDYQAPHAADVPSVSYTEYKLSPDICQRLLGVTPEDFFSQPYPFSWTEDFRTYSKLDENGNLILRLNEQQKRDWRNQYTDEIAVAKTHGIKISADYTYMTTWSYMETIDSDITASILALRGLEINQLLNGQDPAELQITFVVMDAGTQTPVYTALWPIDEVKYTSGEYKLSSITQGSVTGT